MFLGMQVIFIRQPAADMSGTTLSSGKTRKITIHMLSKASQTREWKLCLDGKSQITLKPD